MERILVMSVYDAFDYVMEHYYPAGLEEFAERADSYAGISIQDSHTGGFGFRFEKSRSCVDALTLIFDDTEREVEGAALFSDEQADRIIEFIERNRDRADTLLIHCYGGQSRSRAVGVFAAQLLGKDATDLLLGGNPNPYVYDRLVERAGLG